MSRLFAFCQLARDLSAPLYRGTVATHQPRPTPKDHPRFNDVFFCCDKLHRNEELLVEWPLTIKQVAAVDYSDRAKIDWEENSPK